jgi:L-fuconolactonase
VSGVVDPHMHHWHLSANPWYPLLHDPAMSAIAHDYLADDYRADTANCDVEARVQRPWIEGCLDAFGPDRCMFASNFPVDRMFGSFAALYGTYEEVTAGLPDTDRARLFGATARRVYGL